MHPARGASTLPLEPSEQSSMAWLTDANTPFASVSYGQFQGGGRFFGVRLYRGPERSAPGRLEPDKNALASLPWPRNEGK